MPSGQKKKVLGRSAAALVAVLALLAAPLLNATGAQAVTHTFVVNSLDATTAAKDINVGDGVCATAAGTCTMQAALQETNALNLPAGAALITVEPGFTGNINPVVASRMDTTAVSNFDSGAHYLVTAPVTIDLKNQVTMETLLDSAPAMFHVNGPSINFLNMDNVLSGETSYVMGPKADGVVIDGGTSLTQRSYGPERFVIYRDGAKNITVQNYRLQGFYPGQALFYFNQLSSTPVQNVVIDNVQVTYTVGGYCNASDGSGCRTDLIGFYQRGANVNLDGFTFTNSFVSNITSNATFPFTTAAAAGYSVKASNINISNNQFINMQGSGGSGVHNAFIALPYGPMGGTNVIENNKVTRATSGHSYAVSWAGNTTSGSAGDLRISNNYFNGYSGTSIYLNNTGDVLVEKNTFGARSASQARPAVAEETRDGTSTLVDNAGTANGRVNTWYPSADAAVLTEDVPAGAQQVESPLAEDIPVCVATLDVKYPTAGPYPSATVDLDLYWTQDRTAEIYLGRVEQVSGTDAKLVLDLPVGAQKFPSTVVDEFDEATIVDAATGKAGGYLRLQTIGNAGTQSSQYSRTVGFSGNCRPELTINQADNQNDSTLARDLHYTVESSLPLDPASVSAAVVDVTAAAVTETIDAGRLNPRSVAVSAVEGTANKKFDVVARVDDSAKVTAAIAAEKVTSTGGLKNAAAAKSTDPDITFINPISTKPSSFTLVTGEPDGKQYGFSVAAGAPTPGADLNFTGALDQAGVDNKVNLSTTSPVIPAGKTSSDKVRVTADAGDVVANTPVSIAHTVTSDDTNYDGLVVRATTVKLFSTDPSIRITKRAFVDVADSSTPEQVMATGTEALSGTRLTDGQAVCFVYQVSNISADDWATKLTDVTVTDTDARLGTDGVIGTVAELGVGQSTLLSACGSLIPVDTTVSAP
ncbi:right-handed parallel beta-helix repeat-containing protein [Leucobacter luti]|uniref:right-handed parallel beta-helix repeat-containing protein n=1 Tax=Leucobacter luti TaxID=340320 RepID=UPI00102BE41E|nr:right-handed parallel beta-helix repeat-containing protein [Leucobacter luti]MBL3699145.1 right-handed parallel beta-helix repeat-containing protein [Leucobacter luti]